MATNIAYYEAEDALIAAIEAAPEADLREKLVRFVKRAGTETNRELFPLFNVKEGSPE
jgi:hypothetical protein